jgi:hypothetical protein
LTTEIRAEVAAKTLEPVEIYSELTITTVYHIKANHRLKMKLEGSLKSENSSMPFPIWSDLLSGKAGCHPEVMMQLANLFFSRKEPI